MSTAPSDAELLDRYRQGDARAMDLLVDRHAAAVTAFVRRFLGPRDLARVDDLVQEVWLRVIKNPRGFSGQSRFTTWLYVVARNACLDALRYRKRRPDQSEEAQPPPAGLEAGQRSVPQEAAARELREALEAALAELSPEQREVFLLREHTTLTFQEIADTLEISRDTVKSRMRYALDHLRRVLRSRGVLSREL